MVEYIRKATCDRCGKECSYVEEKILKEDICEQYNIKIKTFKTIAFHYTEMLLKSVDNRFNDDTETKIILCGCCTNDLSDWLKNKKI